jgi:hypothetical protein
MPGETHFFDDIYAYREELGETFTAEVKESVYGRLCTLYSRYNEPADQMRIERLLEEGSDFGKGGWQSYRDVLSALMEYPMHAENKTRWGNNTPRDIFHVNKIIEFYPDAKVIVCVRDVRDFLLSYQGKWRATSDHEVERLKRLYHPVVTSLLWKSSMKQLPEISGIVPRKNLTILHYEDLVANPESSVRHLCMDIDIDYEDSMLDVGTYASSHGKGQSGIFSTSVGRWREKLSSEEAYIAQMIVKKELLGLGYNLEKLRVNPLAVLGHLLTTPIGLARALYANRHKRGPIVPYLIKRIGSLVRSA